MGVLARIGGILRLVRGSKAPVKEIDAAEARRLRAAGAVIVDVREGFEFKRAHVPGAVHIPLGEVEDRAGEIPKDAPVVMHCALGSRSRLAAKRLSAMGYSNVHNLSGGFSEWEKSGGDVERKS